MAKAAPITRRALKALMKRSNVPALMRLPLWLGLLGCTGTLIRLAMGIWWMVTAMFVHGMVMVRHFSLQHECIHFTCFRTRRVNEWVAHWCGLVICDPAIYFRCEHCDHHTQVVGRDPELIPLADSVWGHLEPDDITPVKHAGRRLAVYNATDARRSHGGADLCDGYLDGPLIEGPLHQGFFDIHTGEARGRPATRPIKVLTCRVHDGMVRIRSEG
ncbi:MAG: fatty acid desaturase [Rhodospirillales bacterium]|nr:fatty acid desaturase [Rhodospirillales bacterium]